jgi:hypothetical protein
LPETGYNDPHTALGVGPCASYERREERVHIMHQLERKRMSITYDCMYAED